MGFSFRSSSRLVTYVNDLIVLDREASQAFAAAVASIVDEPMTRGTIESFRFDHERHVGELEKVVRRLGGALPAKDAAHRVRLVKDAATFEKLPGTTSILRALKANEDAMVRIYQSVLQHGGPSDVIDVVRRACNDELRHRAWITARVDAFLHSIDLRTGAAMDRVSRSSTPPAERTSRPSIH